MGLNKISESPEKFNFANLSMFTDRTNKINKIRIIKY